MAPISPDALERWTYRKNGMDYGPFSTKDIYDLVQRHDLDGDTELVNLRTHEKKRVADTARFGAWYRDWLIHEAEQKKRDEVLKEVSKLERVIVRRRKAPWAVVVGLLVTGGIVAFFVLRPSATALADYRVAMFRDLPLEHLAKFTAEEIAARRVVAAPKPEAVAKAAPRSKGAGGARQGTSRSSAVDGNGAPVMVDLSFDADDAGGQVLSGEDLDAVQKKASPALIRCFREEAARRPDFRGGVVLLYLMGRGEVRLSRLNTDPAPSPELGACARGAVGGLHVPPFSGPAQVMEIPVYVTSMR